MAVSDMVGNSSSRRWIGRLTYQGYRFSVAPMMDTTGNAKFERTTKGL